MRALEWWILAGLAVMVITMRGGQAHPYVAAMMVIIYMERHRKRE